MARLGTVRLRPGVQISSLAFSPDSSQLASWGNAIPIEDRLSIWEVATGKELRTQPVAKHLFGGLCWGPGDHGFAVLIDRQRPAGRDAFRLWSFTRPGDKSPPLPEPWDGFILKDPPKQVDWYKHFDLSPDGSYLAAFRTGAAANAGSVDLFDAKAWASGKELNRQASVRVASDQCWGVKFIRGRQTVVILAAKNDAPEASVVIWDFDKDAVSDPVTVPFKWLRQQTFDVANDGSALAVGYEDGTIKVFELPSGKQRLSVKKHDGPKHGTSWSSISALKFVNGSRNVLSAGCDNRQVVWNATTGADVAVLKGHAWWVEAVASSADGKCVATARARLSNSVLGRRYMAADPAATGSAVLDTAVGGFPGRQVRGSK